MTDVTYEIVEHDGGWAYKVGEVFSETFPNREEAVRTARRAAAEQRVGGRDETINYETERGEWKTERSDGGDRPTTHVRE